MSLADSIAKDRGQPANIRIGVVTSTSPLLISVQGTEFREVGVIAGYIPAIGDVVAIAGQSAISADGSSWLVLGQILSSGSGELASVTVSSAVDATAPGTGSVTYVNLSPLVGVAFAAPSSGRVSVSWRARVSPDVATTGRASFVVATGSTVGAGTVVLAASDDRAISSANLAVGEFGAAYLVTGLIPGASYNAYVQGRSSGPGNISLANRTIMVEPVP